MILSFVLIMWLCSVTRRCNDVCLSTFIPSFIMIIALVWLFRLWQIYLAINLPCMSLSCSNSMKAYPLGFCETLSSNISEIWKIKIYLWYKCDISTRVVSSDICPIWNPTKMWFFLELKKKLSCDSITSFYNGSRFSHQMLFLK